MFITHNGHGLSLPLHTRGDTHKNCNHKRSRIMFNLCPNIFAFFIFDKINTYIAATTITATTLPAPFSSVFSAKKSVQQRRKKKPSTSLNLHYCTIQPSSVRDMREWDPYITIMCWFSSAIQRIYLHVSWNLYGYTSR